MKHRTHLMISAVGGVFGALLGFVIVTRTDNPSLVTAAIAPILGAILAFVVTGWVARHIVDCVKHERD